MNIVLTGSVAFDHLMKFPGYFKDNIIPEKLDSISLSFLVDSMIVQKGGIAPNIAYTMALLGQNPVLFVAVGDDFAEYGHALEDQGIDISKVRVFNEVKTAAFFVTTDLDNNQIASFYPGAMGLSKQLSLHEFDGHNLDLVTISPSDPESMDKFINECIDLKIPYLYDPSQQILRLDDESLKKGVQNARYLFVNEYECSLLEKKTGLPIEKMKTAVDLMVVTMGKAGALVSSNGHDLPIPVFPPNAIMDPTGVGDAFRGGFLTGLSMGFSTELCGKMGALAATYCLESTGPQGQSYSITEYIQRFREVFDDQGELDSLNLGL